MFRQSFRAVQRPAPGCAWLNHAHPSLPLVTWPLDGGLVSYGPLSLTLTYSLDRNIPCTASEIGLVTRIAQIERYYQLPSLSTLITSSTGGSVALWVRRTVHTPAAAAETGLWNFGSQDSSHHYPYTDGTIYDGTLRSDRRTVGVGIVTDRTQWHFVTVTMTPGGVWTFYQNGRIADQQSGVTFAWPSTPWVGAAKDYASYAWHGELAELRLWNRPLQESEVFGLWNPATRWSHWRQPRRALEDSVAAAGDILPRPVIVRQAVPHAASW